MTKNDVFTWDEASKIAGMAETAAATMSFAVGKTSVFSPAVGVVVGVAAFTVAHATSKIIDEKKTMINETSKDLAYGEISEADAVAKFQKAGLGQPNVKRLTSLGRCARKTGRQRE